MIQLRRSGERGQARHGWLESRHTFSFADYHDPEHMGFRALRVLNEDRVQPGQGFPPHSHRDMEILTCVLEGALQHQDSLGNSSVIRPGELQRMTAGTGVTHSEYNASREAPVHFLQIWIIPARPSLRPGYEQRDFGSGEMRDRLRLVASPDGRDGSLTLHQDATVHLGRLAQGTRIRQPLAAGRFAWVQVARGELRLNGETLQAGDGAAVSGEPALELEALAPAQLLVFDLA
ncbi:MAG TPA: pirin family protein [Myxococcota bacterium]|nr:pirin family protein [Myxococcota bacterium]